MRLYEAAHTQLSRYCRSICRNAEDASDLHNETVMRAWQQFDELRNPELFRFYLFTIARRNASRYYKKYPALSDWDDARHNATPDSGARPDMSAEVSLLMDALATLPRQTAEAISLFEIAGLSIEEVAAIQQSSKSAVKVRLHRGRAALRNKLSARGRHAGPDILLTHAI